MKTLQHVGGSAALALSVLFVALLVLLAVIVPAQGFGPGTLNDPAKGIAFVATSSLPMVIALIYIGTAVAFVPIVLALFERLRAEAPATMQLVAAAGVIASASFLAYGMITFVGNHTVVSIYQQSTANGAAVYLALRLTGNAINAGALFAAGWAIALTGWTGMHSSGVPTPLSIVMLLGGGAMIGSFVVLPMGLIGVLLAPIWSAWLGVVLLRERTQHVGGGVSWQPR